MNESVCVCVDAIYINIKRKNKKKIIPNSWSPTTRMYFLSCLQFADEKEKKRKNQKQQQRKKIDSNQIHNIEPLSKWVYI